MGCDIPRQCSENIIETWINGNGPDFYQDGLIKLVLRSDKCLNRLVVNSSPNAIDDLRVEALMHVKPVEVESLHIDEVYNFWRGASLDLALVT
ncbi:hypothetical protein TNCV_2224921 [Trichonephila clavipes]|nr:hypothetical protein TNCV_2224921 [Trichonephila clavipes]